MKQATLWGEIEEITTESDLAALAIALGAESVAGWSPAERALASRTTRAPGILVKEYRERIAGGQDPLGEAFCRIRTAENRRRQGATYTPATIVDAMIQWAAEVSGATRVIDPGTGSGRYLMAAGKRYPSAKLVGVEIDPLAAMLARANLAASGLANRSQIIVADYRDSQLPEASRTLFIGNPPYVRHHLIQPKWKRWLTAEAAKLGKKVSQLAGLHVHFFLATVSRAKQGDFGAFITAGEWLDVNYGSILRELFLAELGGCRLDVIEPKSKPFPDAATTGVVTYFQVGAKPKSIRIKRVDDSRPLNGYRREYTVPRERMELERRWSHLMKPPRKLPAGYVELGELCRVHRGQVTGFNRIWIAGRHSIGLPPSVMFPSVTKARELFDAGRRLTDSSFLRCVIDLPVDLDVLAKSDRRKVERFLVEAKSQGAHLGYVVTNRKAWWSVGLREPAPILTTYMARRAPAFVHNKAGARHINIAHGIYPRVPLSDGAIEKLIDHLLLAGCQSNGRTYAGGLTKFEPREVERLLVPTLESLTADKRHDD